MSQRIYQAPVLVQSVALNAHDCPTCGIIYALTEDFENRRRSDGAAWSCPNGHRTIFSETTEQKLSRARDEIESLKDERARLLVRVQEEVAKANRAEKRTRAGVCLFCHRHFSNVERHMNTKHGEPADGENKPKAKLK